MEGAKYDFNQSQINKLKPQDRDISVRCFKTYDTNGDHHMDAKEFKKLMEDMGELRRTKDEPDSEVYKLLDKYDENNDG